MRFTRRDTVATGLVAAVVLVYVAHVGLDGIPFVHDVSGMAAVGLILGFASRRVGGRAGFAHERVAFAAGLGSMALGIAASITESEIMLAVFVASIVGLWAAAVYSQAHGSLRRVPVAH